MLSDKCNFPLDTWQLIMEGSVLRELVDRVFEFFAVENQVRADFGDRGYPVHEIDRLDWLGLTAFWVDCRVTDQMLEQVHEAAEVFGTHFAKGLGNDWLGCLYDKMYYTLWFVINPASCSAAASTSRAKIRLSSCVSSLWVNVSSTRDCVRNCCLMSWKRLVFLVDLGVDLRVVGCCAGCYYLIVADLVGVFFDEERYLVGVLVDICLARKINNRSELL